jgi:hypothetical protein
MKKSLLIIVFLGVITLLFAQRPSIIQRVLENSAKEKVSTMQQLIGFDDARAEQLRVIETRFLLDVNRAEHCFLCNKKRRIRKLKEKRAEKLQELLDRDQYIKYEAIENELLNKNNRLRLGDKEKVL